jgi:hypothetical protein
MTTKSALRHLGLKKLKRKSESIQYVVVDVTKSLQNRPKKNIIQAVAGELRYTITGCAV